MYQAPQATAVSAGGTMQPGPVAPPLRYPSLPSVTGPPSQQPNYSINNNNNVNNFDDTMIEPSDDHFRRAPDANIVSAAAQGSVSNRSIGNAAAAASAEPNPFVYDPNPSASLPEWRQFGYQSEE